MSDYNSDDPRFGGIKRKIETTLAGPVADDYAQKKIKSTYYDAVEVSRSGESDASTYHKLIQNTAKALSPKPARIMLQSGRNYDKIGVDAIEKSFQRDGQAFVHFKKFEIPPATRLYIPCNLAHVNEFMTRLWKFSGLKSFKVVGYMGAVSRADVIVASFGQEEHARVVGEALDKELARFFSGTFPVGARPCSSANLCGWALDDGKHSVGTDAIKDLTTWWKTIQD